MNVRAVQRALSTPGSALAIRYLLITAAANLVWETAQLPLYTIWHTATRGGLAYVVVHCTLGDLAILAAALLFALLLAGDEAWPDRGYARVAILTSALGVSATIVSEWLNVDVWGRWAYAPAMPALPPLGTGLSPLLQWAVVPPLAFFVARHLREI
jgi:hypothetical protein